MEVDQNGRAGHRKSQPQSCYSVSGSLNLPRRTTDSARALNEKILSAIPATADEILSKFPVVDRRRTWGQLQKLSQWQYVTIELRQGTLYITPGPRLQEVGT